jgi:hypothetical protein
VFGKNMAEESSSKPPFWSSLPGMLTGLGAVIVATTGLITALYTTGIIGSKASADPKAASANIAASAANTAETERYRPLAGRWEVIESSTDNAARIAWHYDGAVSGNVLTLSGKIFKIGEDKNLSDDEERMAATFVITLTGKGGLGEDRFKGKDGTSVVADAAIRFSEDLRQFEAKVDAGGRTTTYSGLKL